MPHTTPRPYYMPSRMPQTHHTELARSGCIELFPEFRTEFRLAIKMFDIIILARLNVLLGAVQVIVMSSYSF